MFAVIKTFVTDISASTGKFDTNERVGVFLARHSVQHLVFDLPKKKNTQKTQHFLKFLLVFSLFSAYANH
jgi:hypothetical protein